jgi:CHASE3 domain sensor protein
MEYFNNYGKHLLYILLAAVILSLIGYGTYTHATHLKQDIERKKEIQRLENQKLRLEIEILKKANGS